MLLLFDEIFFDEFVEFKLVILGRIIVFVDDEVLGELEISTKLKLSMRGLKSS